MKKLRLSQKVVAGIMAVAMAVAPAVVSAAAIPYVNDTLSTLTASTAADHTVLFTTPTGAAQDADTIRVTFDTFTLGSVAVGDIDMATSTTACNSSPTFNEVTLGGSDGAGQWGVTVAGQNITFDAPTDASASLLSPNTCVRIRVGTNASGGTNQITNPAASTPEIGISGTFGDTGSTTVTILSDSDVQLTADVAQSLTFSISDNDQTFGTLNSGAARYASTSGQAAETVSHYLTAGTNAASGYSITVAGDTLEAAGALTIDAAGAMASTSAGTEEFGVRYSASGAGSGTVDAAYVGGPGSAAWLSSSTTPDVIATATGSTSNNNFRAFFVANIASNTEAGNYTTTITYVGTANF